MEFKKKLYLCRPDRPPVLIDSYRTERRNRQEPADPQSLQRGVRQLLADRVSGNLLGLWLLVPEHLRLGTWDVLCQWAQQSTERVEPRLALQLVHEAALCVNGVRQTRHLSQRGFELLNGLHFTATDQAVHDLLEAHTVAEAEALQIHLGMLRRALGHFVGKILVIDPHRMRSYSKRLMRRFLQEQGAKPVKVSQGFFCLDAETEQPICFTLGSSAITVLKGTPGLLRLAQSVLNCSPENRSLVVADTEHYVGDLLEYVKNKTPFDLLVLMPKGRSQQAELLAIDPNAFTPRWAGFATTKRPYQMKRSGKSFFQYVQRSGERKEEYDLKGFLSTRDGDEVEDLTVAYPKRWHVEEFFNTQQAMGWKRAGTMNLNVRYGQMSMALIAQAVTYQFRQKIGKPWSRWEANHLADAVFRGIDGDLRVSNDTILVTLYNAPFAERLRLHYERLPEKLAAQGIDSRIPWLYDYKLDFRFK